MEKFEDEKLQALLDEDNTQTLQELAEALNVEQSVVSRRLHRMGIGNCYKNFEIECHMN